MGPSLDDLLMLAAFLPLLVLVLLGAHLLRREAAADLRRFAATLEGGAERSSVPPTYLDARIAGRFEGREVSLSYSREPVGRSRGPTLRLELALAGPSWGCEIGTRGSAPVAMSSRPAVATPVSRPGSRLAVWARGDAAEVARALADPTLAELVEEAFRGGLRHLVVHPTRLEAIGGAGLYPARSWELQRYVRLLAAIARQLERLAPAAAVPAEAHDQPGVRCPYCRDELSEGREPLSACAGCGTVHHATCLVEAGGCTVLGCRGSAPPRSLAR